MEIKDLKKELHMLVDKYVNNESQLKKIKSLINVEGTPGVRGIFAEINDMGIKVKDADADIIKDIFFNFG